MDMTIRSRESASFCNTDLGANWVRSRELADRWASPRFDHTLQIGHKGVTAFGVICNQLDRGGWVVQEKRGGKNILRPTMNLLVSDKAFLTAKIRDDGVHANGKRWWQFWK